MNESKFNQKEYVRNYHKEHKAQFNVDLNKDEREELNVLLKARNMTKADFLRNAIKNLKEEIEMKKYYVHSCTIGREKRGNDWVYLGDLSFNSIDNDIIFDNLVEARAFYDSIKLVDKFSGNSRYSDYKELYEIDEDITDVDDIDFDKAKLIIDEYSYVD